MTCDGSVCSKCSSTSDYFHTANADAGGNDIGVYFAVTSSHCKSLCNSNSLCVGYNYIYPGSSETFWILGGCCTKFSLGTGVYSLVPSLLFHFYTKGTNTYLYNGQCYSSCISPLVINSSLRTCECVKKIIIF